MKKVIAIDGPAASGKSTVAKKVAGLLGGTFVSTGSLYRLIAYYLLSNNIDPESPVAVASALSDIKLTYRNGDWEMNGIHYTSELRQPEVGSTASVIAVYPAVRNFLLETQRNEARGEGLLVMEGRDIGSAIFPEAELKIFLTATPEERARRRLNDEKGGVFSKADLEKMAADIAERDWRDSHRETAPLKAADDARTVDNTNLSSDETSALIAEKFKELNLK